MAALFFGCFPGSGKLDTERGRVARRKPGKAAKRFCQKDPCLARRRAGGQGGTEVALRRHFLCGQGDPENGQREPQHHRRQYKPRPFVAARFFIRFVHLDRNLNPNRFQRR